MASPLVQRFRNDVAPRLLAKFGNGGVSTVVRVLTPDPDPLKPPSVVSDGVEFHAYAKGVSAEMVSADPNLVATDVQVICAAVDWVPSVSAVVEINGSDRTVIRVDAIPAAGDPAIYRFYVR